MVRKLRLNSSAGVLLPAVVLVLVTAPATAMSQERDTAARSLETDIRQRVDYINHQLGVYPAPPSLGRYQINLLPGGKLTIDSWLSDSTTRHYEAYIEDIGSVNINIESRDPPYTTALFVCKSGDCFVVRDNLGILSAKDRGGFDFAFDRRLARQIENAAQELVGLAMRDPTYGPPHNRAN